MKKNAWFTVLLSICAIASTSCSNTGNETQTPITSPLDISTTEITAEIEANSLALPTELDLGGKSIRYLLYDNELVGDIDGDELSVAVYHSTSAAEELLNFHSEYIKADTTDMANVIRLAVSSGEDAYDIIGGSGRWVTTCFLEELFMGVSELQYINLSKPWWNEKYMRSVSLNANDPNMLVGDMAYSSIGSLYVTFFNKRLMNDLLDMSDDELYQMVLDGKWTIDQFVKFSNDIYQDINGNGKKDKDDIYAFVTEEHWNFEAMIYSCGLHYTERDKNGYPVLNMYTQNTVDLIDKLLPAFVGTNCYQTSENIVGSMFANGQSLMCLERFFACSWFFRDMNDDYCIVPMPKFDESTESYSGLNEGNIQWYGVPITVGAPDEVSAVIEALAYYGHQYVRPVFIETSMKTKYSRDEKSSQMIDIIIDGACTDFLYINNSTGLLGKLPEIFKLIYNKKENVFTSLYEKYEKSTMNAFEEILDPSN